MFSALSQLVMRAARTAQVRRPVPTRSSTTRPRLEPLEDRCVPALLPVTSPLDVPSLAGTLRYQVAHAMTGDTIEILTPSPITLTKGQIFLAKDVTIVAPFKAAVISGAGMSRLFDVTPGAHVELGNLVLEDGNGTAGIHTAGLPFDGDGGAVLNQGSLMLMHCTLVLNTAHEGGALFNDHGMVLSKGSTLLVNSAKDDGGAVYNDHGLVSAYVTVLAHNKAAVAGGAVFNTAGDVSLTGSLITGDSATFGGGIFSDHGSVLLTGDTLLADAAKVNGGAIDNEGGSLTVTHCALPSDMAGMFGGGIYTDGGTADLVSDLLASDAAGAHGGGAYHTALGTLTISSSTASGDTPDAEFGAYLSGGGNVGF
jgi:hypothetical protein